MSAALLAHGSLVLVFVWLVLGGLGIPLPEDAALIAAGALIYHGASAFVALAIAFAGVLAGDVILFLLARRLGPAAYERPLFRRLLPPARRRRIEDLYRRHGGWVVFVARHVVGIRAATFALAGIHGMRLRRFVAWDALGACTSVPLYTGLGYAGALHVERVRAGVATVEHYLLLALIVVAIGYLSVRALRRRLRRARGES